MAKQAVARVTEPEAEAEAPIEAREAPTLKPACLEINSDGQKWREWLLRAPAELILQDLGEPSIFRVIQQSQKSLRALDRITVVAYDESWIARDVLVTSADGFSATLGVRASDVLRVQSKTATFQTERHTIRWNGAGYSIFRRDDDVQLTPNVYASIDAAKNALYKEFETIRKVA